MTGPLPVLPPGAIMASGMRHVQAVLDQVPPGHRFAVVTQYRRTGDVQEARTGVALRLGDAWAVAVEAAHEWGPGDGTTTVTAGLLWSK